MKQYSIEIKWALIFVAFSLLWMFGEKIFGLYDANISKHAIYTNFIAIPAIAIYVIALLDKKKSFYNGHMTYKQGFVTGAIITVMVTILSPLTQYIATVIIAPEYYENMSSYAVKAGKMSAAEASAYFNLKSYILQGLVGA
ncbi:MAG: DUF4199 domain-containing protein, partial [Chitinophagaceae bacterium]